MLFEPKRLVYMAPNGPDAGEAAIAQVEKEVKEQVQSEANTIGNADSLVAAAKAKLPKVLNDEAIESAEAEIDKAKGRFEKLVAAVTQRIALKTAVNGVKIDGKDVDSLRKAEMDINKLKTDKAALIAVFGKTDSVLAAVDEKEKEVQAAASRFYTGIGEMTLENITTNGNKKDYDQVMTQVAQMQEASYNGFPGAAESDKDALKKDFALKISAAVAALDQYQNQIAGLSEDEKASLKRFKFGIENLDAAEKEKDPGHLAGAKQYMEMNLAEQEAKRVLASIVEKDSLDDAYKKLYEEADKAFQDAQGLAEKAKGSGKPSEAAAKFKEATEKWKEVLESQQTKKPKELKSTTENDVGEAEKAMTEAKGRFTGKYGGLPLAETVVKQAESILSQLQRSGMTDEFEIKINKEAERIYTEGGPALAANKRVMEAFRIFQEKKGVGTFDITANIIYQDGLWRLERGNFVEATQKFNECAQIYEAINDDKAPDRNKSYAVIDGEVVEGTEPIATSKKAEAEAARQSAASLKIDNLLATHFTQAEDGMNGKYYARAINQYQQAINMIESAQAAADIYNTAGLTDVKPGTDVFDFTKIGNKYYNEGSFAEAKTFYQYAADANENFSEASKSAS